MRNNAKGSFMMHRIEKLRLFNLDSAICYDEFFYNFYKFCSQKDVLNDTKLYGDAFYFAFSQITPNISEDELIVGKSTCRLSCDAQKEWDETYLPIAQKTHTRAGYGQDS